MGVRFRSWWQHIKQHPFIVAGIIVVSGLLVALIVVEVRANGTGFAGKTLWDWLQLLAALAIPLVVGFGAVWFTIRQGKVADAENIDNQREAALQAYLNDMSELLLHENLLESQPRDKVRTIARVGTITILFQLDARRIGYVFSFLRETGLSDAQNDDNIVSFRAANLEKINFSKARLQDADLSLAHLRDANLSHSLLSGVRLRSAQLIRANLTGADMEQADLKGANLYGTNLSHALLIDTYLYGATLSKANLKGAYVTEEQMKVVGSLKGATMPDGSIHE